MINAKAGYVTPGQFVPSQKELNRRAKNKAVLMSGEFADACQWVGIDPTKRQAVKFKMKKGRAYKLA